MSGGFTPSLKRSSVEISGRASFLASEHYMVKRGGITLDADAVEADSDGNKILEAGTFVSFNESTGKYEPTDGSPGDPEAEPPVDPSLAADPDRSGYLLESVNLRDGDVICGMIIHGSVLEARVTPSPVPDEIRTAVAGRITYQ